MSLIMLLMSMAHVMYHRLGIRSCSIDDAPCARPSCNATVNHVPHRDHDVKVAGSFGYRDLPKERR